MPKNTAVELRVNQVKITKFHKLSDEIRSLTLHMLEYGLILHLLSKGDVLVVCT